MTGASAPSEVWGDLDWADAGDLRLSVGPLDLWIRGAHGELWIATLSGDDPAAATLARHAAPFDPPESASVIRLVGLDPGLPVTMTPALADRPMVVRPQAALHVAPGGTLKVFLSTPLWIQFRQHPPGPLLHEAPTFRPSDTWLGPNYREGEICYAARTRALTRLNDSPQPPARALTLLEITNHAPDLLGLARVKLPVPNLAVYANDAGEHWTDSVRIVRGEDGDLEGVEIVTGPPAQAGAALPVAKPREPPRPNLLTRALTAMFDQGALWTPSSQAHESS